MTDDVPAGGARATLKEAARLLRERADAIELAPPGPRIDRDVRELLQRAGRIAKRNQLVHPKLGRLDPTRAGAAEARELADWFEEISAHPRVAASDVQFHVPVHAAGARWSRRVGVAVRLVAALSAFVMFGIVLREHFAVPVEATYQAPVNRAGVASLTVAQLPPLPAVPQSRQEFLERKPDRYVTDFAAILPGDRAAALNERLAQLERETSNQLIVVTAPKVPGDTSIEELGADAISGWGIGQKGRDNGVILFVFPESREMRLEVGYGLEGILPDARAKNITSTVIRPQFERGDMAAGVEQGVAAIVDVIVREGFKGTGRTAAELQRERVIDILPLVFVFLVVLTAILFGGRGSTRGGSRSSSSSSSSSSSGGSSSFSGGGGSGGGGGASERW